VEHDFTFLERWILPAAPEMVFAAVADFELYPKWGRPAYLAGSRQGKPGVVGTTGRLVARGALPYKLKVNCRVTRVVPGRELELTVGGDLEGVQTQIIRPLPDGTSELISDFRCNPRRSLIRALTPLLRPVFFWNHQQAMNPAMAGLARYLAARTPDRPAGRRRTAHTTAATAQV
jgi:uncharacterized protein YndB with AHSA1/START domain